jgi:NitT/TauT family transport system ATP-binding protein
LPAFRLLIAMVTHDVEEALLLANRVIVLTERPARVKAEIVNDLPYPRHRDEARFVQMRRQLMEYLSMEGAL